MSSSTINPSDQGRALWLSTIAFTVCFAVWTIFAIIGIQIKADLGLSDTQFGLLVGTPILTGSLIRLILGIWSDQYGGRIVYTLTMLSAAVMTGLLTFAYDYPTFLLAALGVGIAGGSFSVGVAYVAKWYPKEKQGTALGIFGAGNVGAAVTKFAAPVIMVAYGWKTVALVWAAVLAATAVIFFLFTKDDPDLARRRATGQQPEPLSAMLAPLRSIQVWRFSLYYFFVFGAFVALALWLPRYLIGVYGLDITTAGMIGAMYSIPASVFRAYGGHLSDKYGARRIMYWTFLVSVACTFILSYPPTQYVVEGIRGPVTFSTRMGLVGFIAVAFVLGFFMSLGKAAVYKHIPVYYPDRVGAVGGVVGLVGGLGGFVLPIAFGALNDLTGVWQSCFWLLFLIATVSLVWMHIAIREMERSAVEAGVPVRKLPELPEMQPVHGPAQEGALAAKGAIQDWRPEEKNFWEGGGRAIARRNLWISVPCLLLSFAVWMVWSVVVAKLPSVGFAWRDAAHLLQLHAGHLRWPLVDDACNLVSAHSGARHGLRCPEPQYALLDLPWAGAALRLRRRQLCLLYGQHLLLLPEGGEGERACDQRRPRQSRRQRRAVRGAAGDHDRRIWLAWRRSSDRDRQRRHHDALAAECRLRFRSFHRRVGVRRMVRHG